MDDREAARLAQREELLDDWPEPDSEHAKVSALEANISGLRRELDKFIAEARAGKPRVTLPLAELRDYYSLAPEEFDILLIALAASLNAYYGGLLGYLQNDSTHADPSVNLALNLLGGPVTSRLARRRYFLPSATLFRHGLLRLNPVAVDGERQLLRQHFRIDEPIAGYLLGQKMPVAAELDPTANDFDGLAVDAPTLERLRQVAAQVRLEREQAAAAPSAGGQKQQLARAVVRFVGRQAEITRSAAEAVAAHSGFTRAITIDLSLEATDLAAIEIAVRDARLFDAVLLALAPVTASATPPRARVAELNLWQALHSAGVVFLLGPEGAFGRPPSTVDFWNIDVSAAEFDRRQEFWKQAIGPEQAKTIDSVRLATDFRFAPAQVRQAVHLAKGLARQRGKPLHTHDLLVAGRELTAPQISPYARRTRPSQEGWGALQLPPEKMDQLRQIEIRRRYRHTVYNRWGYGDLLPRGKGLIALFTGPSGTGKTYAAERLASRLQVDLYQIDLAGVLSKYIGETEAHLGALFDAAEESGAMLFFDEADALFGKRTETKDAHDRYANIQVDYLLQRVEAYEGLVVLATNLQRNMDEAFVRRIQEIVEFPPPDEAARAAILKAHLPAKFSAVTDDEIGFVARRFEFTGGNLKNIALDAAFRAASARARDPQKILMEDLVRAVAAELRKESRLCLERDFEPHQKMLVFEPPVDEGPAS